MAILRTPTWGLLKVDLNQPPDLKDVLQQSKGLVNDIMGAIVYAPLFVLPVVFAIAGFMYLTSAGNEQKIAQARSLMLWALLGFVVYVAAVPFVKMIIQFFGGGKVDPTRFNL